MATTVNQVSSKEILAHAKKTLTEVQAVQFRKDTEANVQLARIPNQHTAT